MTVARETIEAAISRWEKKARAELYLSENLHPKARAWLADEMEGEFDRALFEARNVTIECQSQAIDALATAGTRLAAISDREYDRIASEPPPRKGKNKG